jgi:hypothetical protein
MRLADMCTLIVELPEVLPFAIRTFIQNLPPLDCLL